MKSSIVAFLSLAVPASARAPEWALSMENPIQVGQTCPGELSGDWSKIISCPNNMDLEKITKCVIETLDENTKTISCQLVDRVNVGDSCSTCENFHSGQQCLVQSVDREDIVCHVVDPITVKDGDACPANDEFGFHVVSTCSGDCDSCIVDEVGGDSGSEVGAEEIMVTCKCEPLVNYETPVKGALCAVETLEGMGYTITEPCCSGEDKSQCPEHKQCRIAEVSEKNLQCRCVAAAKVDDKCDADLLFPIAKACDDDCAECRVKKVGGEEDAVECGCVDVGDKECEVYAYDSCNYCRDHPPKKCEDNTGYEVSVAGDATYKVITDDEAKICSGGGEEASGTLCPTEGSMAVDHCRKHLMSYKDGKCQAPENAECKRLKTTGAWGCVFPTNANEGRGCLKENVCTEMYEKVEGTDLCKVTSTGYPIQNQTVAAEQNVTLINTTGYAEPSATVSYQSSEEGFASITNVLSLVVGMFTTALAIFASL